MIWKMDLCSSSHRNPSARVIQVSVGTESTYRLRFRMIYVKDGRSQHVRRYCINTKRFVYVINGRGFKDNQFVLYYL